MVRTKTASPKRTTPGSRHLLGKRRAHLKPHALMHGGPPKAMKIEAWPLVYDEMSKMTGGPPSRVGQPDPGSKLSSYMGWAIDAVINKLQQGERVQKPTLPDWDYEKTLEWNLLLAIKALVGQDASLHGAILSKTLRMALRKHEDSLSKQSAQMSSDLDAERGMCLSARIKRDSREKACSICYEERGLCVMIPCMCMAICQPCSSKWLQDHRSCPTCRKGIDSYVSQGDDGNHHATRAPVAPLRMPNVTDPPYRLINDQTEYLVDTHLVMRVNRELRRLSTLQLSISGPNEELTTMTWETARCVNTMLALGRSSLRLPVPVDRQHGAGW